MPLAPLEQRRTSAAFATSGRKAAQVVEAAPPPAEAPWWMRVAGEEPLTNLNEVMEQFLDEEDMETLQHMAERATKKVDVRSGSVMAVIPGANTLEVEALHGWNTHVQKFLHYRSVVQQKHDHKNLPGRRRGHTGDGDSDGESDSASIPSEADFSGDFGAPPAFSSEASSVASPRLRGGKAGSRWGSVKSRLHETSPGSPRGASRRPSASGGAARLPALSFGSEGSSTTSRRPSAVAGGSRLPASAFGSEDSAAGGRGKRTSLKPISAASIAIDRMDRLSRKAAKPGAAAAAAKAGGLQRKNSASSLLNASE